MKLSVQHYLPKRSPAAPRFSPLRGCAEVPEAPVSEGQRGPALKMSLNMYLSIYLSLSLSTYLSIYLSISLSLYTYIYIYMYIYIYIYIYIEREREGEREIHNYSSIISQYITHYKQQHIITYSKFYVKSMLDSVTLHYNVVAKLRPVFKSRIWKSGPGLWETLILTGYAEVSMSDGSGIRDPQLEISQAEIMYIYIYIHMHACIYIYIYIIIIIIIVVIIF